MASLSEVAYYSRQTIKYGGVGLLGFLILWWGGSAVAAAWKAAHPPYVPPTVRFGILPKIAFPSKSFEKKDFTLELPNDAYPKFADQAKVYVIYRSKSVIGALEQAKKTAALIGFNKEPRAVSAEIYVFNDAVSNKTLTMNVLADSFRLTYPYLTDQLLVNPSKMPSKEEAVSEAKAFLQQAGKLYKELEEGETKTSFWKIDFNALKEVTGLDDADLVRVDFYRKQFEGGQEMVGAEVDKSSVSVLVSGSTVMEKKIVEVNYKYVNVDMSAPATYPIKTPEAAYNDLKIGAYWPAKDNDRKSVAIRKISLAYFEPTGATQFLEPVYVFEGDGGFVAYVPAITDKYLQ